MKNAPGDLFAKPAPKPAAFAIVANIDGGARGNPGPAAYGVVVRNAKGEILAELGKYLGAQTNNVAEYSGLLAALDWSLRGQHASLKVLSDSMLVVQQMRRQWKVKDSNLRLLYDRAQDLAAKLEHFAIEHVPREANRAADRLVNEVLDRHARNL